MRRVMAVLAVGAGFTVFYTAFFWPVFRHGLIFGDAVDQLIEALPMYLGAHSSWQPLTMLGFPFAANPLTVTWYPLAALRFVPGSYDVYELSAYIIAACGAFGLARAVTRSTTGAIVAGLVYPLSGFMIGHAGHIGLIHPAAWAPWVFWALVGLREHADARHIAFTATAYALLEMAGQPQVLIYLLFASAAYCIVVRSWRFTACFVGALALGSALAAITLLPGIELAAASVRVHLSLEEHVSFGVPIASLLFRLFFPYLLGQTSIGPYTLSNFNIGSFAEMSDYVGVTTLALALIGATARDGLRVGFWSGLFVASLALSTGNDLGLGTLTYHIPALNWLRAPGRYAFEVALATSVLAAAGVAAIERAAAGPRFVAACLAAVGAVMLTLLAVLRFFGNMLAIDLARDFGFTSLPAHAAGLTHNPALWIPAATFALGCVTLFIFAFRPRAAAARAALVLIAIVDMSSFAWFGYWHYGAFPLTRLTPPAYAETLRAAMEPGGQRMLSVPTQDVGGALAPNLNILWNVAGVRGYTTLALARSAAYLRVDSLRTLGSVLADGDRTLDAAGVRYAVVPQGITVSRPLTDPFDPGSALALRVGSADMGEKPDASLALPIGPTTSRLALVSFLAGGAGIADGTPVADLRLTDAAGHAESVTLLSGAGPARIDILTLPAPIAARRLDVQWRGPSAARGAIDIERLSLLDDGMKAATPITALTFLLAAPQRWQPVPTLAGGDRIFQNVRAFPRAWIVHRVLAMPDERVLAAITAGDYDPAQVALVSGQVPALAPRAELGSESVSLERLAPAGMVLNVHCVTRCAVITSDALYPGWSARIDSQPAPIFAADYALRGVAVPAGTHRVVFTFRSLSTYTGAAITLVALILTGCLMLRRPRPPSSACVA